MKRAAVGLALFLLVAATACWSKPDQGEIGVQRGAGTLEGSKIKGVLCPGSGTKTIWNDKVHYYPHSGVGRYYTITADPGRADSGNVDVVKVPSADGKLIGLEGTIYFTTGFDCSPAGRNLLEKFDDRYGVRTFPKVGASGEAHPYEANEGWAAFLDTIVRPVIDNELRQAVQQFDCAQLISSCALVVSQGQTALGTKQGRRANVNFAKIQNNVNSGLVVEIKDALGDDYLRNFKFRLSRLTLEPALQNAINQAQASFAQVAQATAQVAQATRQAAAARQLANLYRRSPGLASIEMLKIVCGQTKTNETAGGGCNGAQLFLGVGPTGVNVAGRGR